MNFTEKKVVDGLDGSRKLVDKAIITAKDRSCDETVTRAIFLHIL